MKTGRSAPSFLPKIAFAIALGLCLPACEENEDLAKGHDFGSNNPDLYVAMGDSITAGNGVSYPDILASKLGKPVENLGVPGVTSDYGAGIVNGVLASRRPGFVLILYGPNDVINGHDEGITLNNLRAMVYAAKNNKSIAVLATLTPMIYGHEGFNAAVMRLNAAIRSMADSGGIALADLEAEFIGRPHYMTDDGLHPNDQGRQAMAETFYDTIKGN